MAQSSQELAAAMPVPEIPPLDDGDDAALDDQLREVSYTNGRNAALFLAAFVAVLWPTDWLVLGSDAVQLTVASMRALTIALAVAAYLILSVTRFGRRRPMAVLGTGGVLIVFVIGWTVGRLGPDQPFIHMSHAALFFAVIAPLRLRWRALLVGAMAAALLAGYLSSFPAPWAHPATPMVVSFLASTAVMVVALGHLYFRILRKSVFQSRALERASRQLADLNDNLEGRVRDQTSDLRRLTAHLERARDEERTRIARELHDELGQELTALRLAVSLLHQRWAKGPSSIGANLDEIEGLIARTTATARQIVSELRPPILDDLGLSDAIEWMVDNTRQRAGLACRLRTTDLAALPAELGTVAFRVVQEALTNVVRHAKAGHVEVEVAVRGAHLIVQIADDGLGMPSEAPPSGFGLIGMRERVSAIDGRLEIDSEPGRGTRLRAVLPLFRDDPKVMESR